MKSSGRGNESGFWWSASTAATADARANRWFDASVSALDGELVSLTDWVHDVGEYIVVALPSESPSDGGRTLEVNPDDVTASPFGWHDTDGVAGAEFTITQGNNV